MGQGGTWVNEGDTRQRDLCRELLYHLRAYLGKVEVQRVVGAIRVRTRVGKQLIQYRLGILLTGMYSRSRPSERW
jgi:hypothetical protein